MTFGYLNKRPRRLRDFEIGCKSDASLIGKGRLDALFGHVRNFYWLSCNFYHHNRLLAKACPEPDLRYRSNSTAFDSSEKARWVMSFQDLYLVVCGERPSL